jgi:hypothetical protein
MEIPPEILAAQEILAPIVLVLPGVIGVDVGLREENGVIIDEIVLRVLVADLADIPPGIPAEVSGIPVTIVQRNPQLDADLARYPTLVGGISISNRIPLNNPPNPGVLAEIEIGTLGGIARENNTGELRGITCEHVLGSVVGTDVYQPLVTTLPPPLADRVGAVVRASFPTTPNVFFHNIPTGFTDAASFSIERAAAAQITQIGFVSGSSTPKLGDRVIKRGATTLLTHGIITAVFGRHAMNRNALLLNQIEVTVDRNLSQIWSANGDSGALVIRQATGEVLGLHWGGDSGKYGYASDIEITAAELDVSFFWPIPQVWSVSPAQCQSQGGDQVLIEGVGFQLASRVLFGANPAASFVVQNDRQITAVTPPGNGFATITVTAPGGTSDALIGASIAYF